MLTTRMMERLWDAGSHGRLLAELLTGRPEASIRLEEALDARLGAAAMTIVRLDEIFQPNHPLYTRLVNVILSAQNNEGGWGDPATTAVCLRALLTGRGHGVAIDRGLAHLASLQKSDGAWPGAPIRRLDADPFTTAFVLFALGGHPQFADTVRFDEAIEWFASHAQALDAETRRLWDRAAPRCRATSASRAHPALWS
jgi:hypothetical protein